MTARSTQSSCEGIKTCALESPLQTLAEQSQHYALLLDKGELALIARLHLIQAATTRIDLQTYIFDTDDSARLIIDALLAAARRGVQVRLLVDQLSAFSDVSFLAALAGNHINFELRIYNPAFNKSRLNYWDYAASVVCCFRRFNQRMHNKLLIIDDRIGITGGRNYQNDYFDWDAHYNFRDRDVMIFGPAVAAMSSSFEAYWTAPRSIAAHQLKDVGRRLLRHGVPDLPPATFTQPQRIERVTRAATDSAFIARTLLAAALPVESVVYLADPPRKHSRKANAPSQEELRIDILQTQALIDSVQSEILLQTPYLVLSRPAQAMFRQLHRRNQPPRIVVSTNSLAATDNPIVYALSYKYKRRNLRELGFNLYEYKPFPLDPPRDYFSSAALYNASEAEAYRLRTETRPTPYGTGRANRPFPLTRDGPRRGLHAKSMVIDRRISIIGTHNFDPRSENYNTEGIVVIDDARFARQLAQSILRDIHPVNSWTVAPRQHISRLNYGLGKVSESLPVLDIWPWRYATNYQFQPSPQCPAPLHQHDPDFYRCYQLMGDFPEVDVGPKWLLVRMLTAFGAGLVPIL